MQALLEYWPRPYAVEEESDVDAGVIIYTKIAGLLFSNMIRNSPGITNAECFAVTKYRLTNVFAGTDA